MIRLVNGRGQLGENLKKTIKKTDIKEEIFIYHTWNILDKGKDAQEEEFRKFKSFVDDNLNKKIIFTSTYSEKENFYNHYKQISEAYLISNNPKGYVIRLPTLIGKGICEEFRNQRAKPFGKMELMSLEKASEKVIGLINYNGPIRSFRAQGDIIPAKLTYELINFGNT